MNFELGFSPLELVLVLLQFFGVALHVILLTGCFSIFYLQNWNTELKSKDTQKYQTKAQSQSNSQLKNVEVKSALPESLSMPR